MTTKRRLALTVVVLAALIVVGLLAFDSCYYVETIREYHEPAARPDEVFADDPVPAQPPPFDPALVDSRKLGGWEVNSSSAVIRLDCPGLKPEEDEELQRLHACYAAALDAAGGREVLPSVNLIDGKAKQFDDGLYAAVDLAAYRGVKDRLAGCVDLVTRLRARCQPGSGAASYLDAAKQIAGGYVGPPTRPMGAPDLKQSMLDAFFASQTDSKPIGFYTWSKELQTLWRTERFLAQEFGEPKASMLADLAAALKVDPQLLADYRKFVGLFRGLTNPYECLSLDELPEGKLTEEGLAAEAKKRGARHAAASFLPPSTSRENELVERLWPISGADLMRELIRRIRSGEVNLAPRPNAGWYDYQVYALETLLLPGRGEEKGKLVLTARYKQRMKEAFEALLTKRRETHARALTPGCATAPFERPHGVSPRLRLEPNATYYLRTARAYAFVENLLVATLGEKELAVLHGLRQEGGKVANRPENLAAELAGMRALFYGFYIVSCEDLGLRPQFMDGENVDAAAAKAAAEKWLAGVRNDPDLDADTRVSVPVVVDESGTELWATIGVRLMKLDAEYVFPPSIREPGENEWKPVEKYECGRSEYLIPVDTFVAFRLKGNRVLTREELRAAIDKAGTKEKFLEAMRKR